jgi:hypothetical protein
VKIINKINIQLAFLFLCSFASAQIQLTNFGNFRIFSGAAVTSFGDFTHNGNLTVDNGATLTNNGTLTFKGGTISNTGTFVYGGSGSLVYADSIQQTSGAELPNTNGPSTVTIDNTGGLLLSSSSTINNLNFTLGDLSINGKTLTLNGAITNTSGSFTGSPTSNLIIGGAAGTINFNQATPSTSSLNNFSINNSSGATLNTALNIHGTVTVSGTLDANGKNLVLKSDSSATASIAAITGTINNATNITAERYISARKAWRFLSIPTNTAQTIKQAWQEGCGNNLNCVSGFGTQITGAGGTAAGFDVYTSTPSMKTYDPASNTWVGIPNTNSTIIKATDGYMVFIRGDRNAVAFNSTPAQTVLRTTGALYIGNLTPIAVSAGMFASIGNPYPSALDMRNITKTGLKDFFYVWDPQLAGSYGYGGYQTFSNSGGNYVITPGGGSYGTIGSISNYIQSGQAFFVQGDVGGGSLTFKENAKASGSRLVTVAASAPQPQLLGCLLGVNADSSTYMADGFLVNYGDNYSNDVDDMDALKLTNTSENLSIKNNNILLVVERRHTILQQDTIFLNLTNVKAQAYRFKFTTDQLYEPGINGFLVDSYLNTTTPINIDGNTTVNFNIVNIPGSYAANRFMIVFSLPPVTLPVTFTSVKAFSQGSNINVEWKVDNESNIKQYVVEKSSDGNSFSSIAVTPATANNSGSATYGVIDTQPVEGYNYYRVKSIDSKDAIATSNIVKVLIIKGNHQITAYPNPIINSTINLELNDQPSGQYIIKLFNKSGQTIFTRNVQHTQGNSIETLKLGNYAPKGIYQLEVISPDGTLTNINIIN